MKSLITLALGLVLATSSLAPAFAARCVGADPCKACTTCKRCAHCKAGGVCGVCKPRPPRKDTNPIRPGDVWGVQLDGSSVMVKLAP